MTRIEAKKTTNRMRRRYPMNKPDGFVPAVQRYSARFPNDVQAIQILYVGVQTKMGNDTGQGTFLADVKRSFRVPIGPTHFDFARFTDPQGYLNVFAVAYWCDTDDYRAWIESAPVKDWWLDPAKTTGNRGYFRESMASSIDHIETIAFKEYIRGLSACPMSRVVPMGESGYWGAARDRIPASSEDRLESPYAHELTLDLDRDSINKRVVIQPPPNLVLIRSGVSWADCGEEQLRSYQTNIEPKLDIGMEYLRTSPIESGCLSLRQVDVISAQGGATKEAYSAGYFLSLHHLETWAKQHPTHLAIYRRAQMERKKYQERLELRTYHEVYVIDQQAEFEYVNCHNRTGLLPYFTAMADGK
ncbi:MAG: phenylacetaldoxime dehydratase family protein [Proteobacteria bacterium]|nr:phenylacetaldoxime dehydratase family protein [Pseudomonadota bacterium]